MTVATAATDALGRTLRVGDRVGGCTSGRYQVQISGPIVQIGSGKVKISVETTDSKLDVSVGSEKWLAWHRVFRLSSRTDGLPASGDWSPDDEAAIRTRIHEADDPLVRALADRIAYLSEQR